MEKLRLDAKELMCLAAAMGITEIFGIPDGFRGISNKALNAEIMLVQQSLERKGVLQMDFDGNVSFNRAYLAPLETMLRCDRFLAVDRQLRSEQTGYLFYGSKDRITESKPEAGEYVLCELSSEDFLNGIEAIMVWDKATACLSDKPCAVSQKRLGEIKSFAVQGNGEKALSELMKCGCGMDLAKLVLDAFTLKTSFYSFAFADITARHNAVKSIMFIDDPRGVIKMQPAVVNDVNHVELTVVSREQMASELLAVVESFAKPKSSGKESS